MVYEIAQKQVSAGFGECGYAEAQIRNQVLPLIAAHHAP
jgi:hypothetical protein